MSFETYLVVPDIHVPFHDTAFTEAVSQAIGVLRPSLKGMVQLGDALDCWQISTYDKDPMRIERISSDVVRYNAQLDEWEDRLPKGSVFHQLEGNHEYRLTRYLAAQAPALADTHPTWQQLLEFPARNARKRVSWQWHDLKKWDSCKIGDTVFHHGKYFDTHTAVSNLKRYPCNLVQGHSHRVQYAEDGYKWSCALGHGSRAEKTMHDEVPSSWQQAFGVYDVIDGRGHLTVVRFKNNACVVRNKLIRVAA